MKTHVLVISLVLCSWLMAGCASSDKAADNQAPVKASPEDAARLNAVAGKKNKGDE